jgi:serine/threonine-protein kinase RsbT
MGAPSLTAHTTATVTSELTRNIVLYAGRGELTFEGGRNPGSWIVITAVDQGPGIASLELVLSGNYRSRTGMGKGLLGVRRLCDRFDVVTSAQGTRIEVQVRW